MKFTRFVLGALFFSINIGAATVGHLCTCDLNVGQTKEWNLHFKHEKHDDVMNLSLTLRENGKVVVVRAFPQFRIAGSFDFLKPVEFVRTEKVDVYAHDSNFIDIVCYVPCIIQQTFQTYKEAGPIESINVVDTNSSCDIVIVKYEKNWVSFWVIDYYNLYKVSLE
ncbi:TPA: hypothetical protein DEO28_00770 [Candidatus Dependentiae bacterium]|nr:MAG: hypothetical protein UR14_C0003G0006 [candidate division TM6 bacterium GW2011_GWE2_31_21]KKP54126.1 MAG: hypothetical protein UR43_C0001G0144 [candidate division TM6 bacterium GW2011_GWF2_33_332]HBS47847.1 hypothetical protein [Candidatus Dependentiae bacterium]HBZ73032.1 hypothetical protein [Candidatus Dependentiae bacterium]